MPKTHTDIRVTVRRLHAAWSVGFYQDSGASSDPAATSSALTDRNDAMSGGRYVLVLVLVSFCFDIRCHLPSPEPGHLDLRGSAILHGQKPINSSQDILLSKRSDGGVERKTHEVSRQTM